MGLVYKLGHRTAKKWGSLQIVFSSNTIEKKQYIHLQPTNIGKRSDSARVMFPVDKTKSF
jgi:phosphoketolase